MNSYSESLKLNTALIAVAAAVGVLIMFMPVWYVLAAVLGLALVAFFAAKPHYCYYAMIFTIPFTERIRALPVSFSVNDSLIFLCAISVLINLIFKGEKASFKTGLDKWIIALLALYFLAGITSINSSGILTSLKFLEAIIAFYLTIYFIRTKKVKVSNIIRVLIITGLFQALLGTLQSYTGSFGAFFKSDRNILGYFGIGSTSVWHGIGTMGHFNELGNFLVAILLFFIPIYHFHVRNKKAGKSIISILVIGIITTYSRGSLLGLFFSGAYFLSQIVKDKLKFSAILGAISLLTASIYTILNASSYVSTLTPRDPIWNCVMASITSCARFTWFGAGLNSYWDAVSPYIPGNVIQEDHRLWYAHNFYLLSVQEMGIIGAVILFSFITSMFVMTLKNFKKLKKLPKTINLSVSLCVFSIYFVSLFDHAYSLTFFKILLFLMLGIIYAGNTKLFVPAEGKELSQKAL